MTWKINSLKNSPWFRIGCVLNVAGQFRSRAKNTTASMTATNFLTLAPTAAATSFPPTPVFAKAADSSTAWQT